MDFFSFDTRKVCFTFWFSLLFALNIYAQPVVTNGATLKVPLFEVKVGTDCVNSNFGFHFTSQKITPLFPVSIKTGNLSAGGILSKMKQPLLSGLGTPFGTGNTSVSNISAALPSYTSYSKPISSFFQFSFAPKQKSLPQFYVNCWYSKEEEIISSSIYTSSTYLKNKIKIKSAFCVGQFPYSENTDISWQPKEPYYKQGEHLVSSFNTSLELWRTFLYFGITSFESPFGTVQNSYRADIKYSGKHFIYGLSGAYNGDKIVSASDERIKESLQLRSNLQYKDTLRLKLPLFWKIGFTTFGNIKLAETEQQIKTTLGTQLRYGLFSLSLSSAINTLLDTEDINYPIFTLDSYNFKSILSFSFSHIATSLTLGAAFTPKENFESFNKKYNGKIQVFNSGKTRFNSAVTYSCSIHDDLVSTQKMSLGSSIEFKSSFFMYSIKISADIDI